MVKIIDELNEYFDNNLSNLKEDDKKLLFDSVLELLGLESLKDFKLNVGEKGLIKVLGEQTGMQKNDVKNFVIKHGDIGSAGEEILNKHSKLKKIDDI